MNTRQTCAEHKNVKYSKSNTEIASNIYFSSGKQHLHLRNACDRSWFFNKKDFESLQSLF